MAPRLRPWLAGAALLLAACGGGAQDLATVRPTAPSTTPGPTGTGPTTTTVPAGDSSATPWGGPPVVAPAALLATATAYYDGAGPVPEDVRRGPSCLLMLPTALPPGTVKPVPASEFNIFNEFVVRWAPASGRGTALTLSVLPVGDPTDRYYFAASASVMTFADGSALRTAPQHPRGVLLQVGNENCEYILQPGASLPAAADGPALLSLRLIFAP